MLFIVMKQPKIERRSMEITLKDCSVKIKDQVILQHVNFEIQAGRFYHLFGENGSGKSIFLQSMLGLTPFVAGKHTITYRKADLCYITSIPFYFDNEKARSVIKLLGRLYNVQLESLTSILNHLALEYDAIANKRMAELSQGTRQKIVLVPLFLQHPQFFVLDEIFVGFDEQTQQKVITRLCELARQKKTIVFVEHNASIMHALKESIEMEEFVCKNQTVLRG